MSIEIKTLGQLQSFILGEHRAGRLVDIRVTTGDDGRAAFVIEWQWRGEPETRTSTGMCFLLRDAIGEYLAKAPHHGNFTTV
jgi:hypothetical protein